LEQIFTAHIFSLLATSALGLQTKCWSFSQRCYLYTISIP